MIRGWFSPDGSGTYNPAISADDASSEVVTTESALRLAAVWACVRLISETIGSLPMGMYQKTNGGRAASPALNHPLHLIIHDQPSSESTASMFWEAFVVSMLLQGNGFAEKLYMGKRLVGLRFLDPSRLEITKLAGGRRRYYYTYDDDVRREVADESVWRVPGFTLNGTWGVSAITYGASIMGGAQAANRVASTTFSKGLMQTVAFTYPTSLKDQQRTEARKRIEALSGAANAGKPIIMENGETAQVLGVKPSDAQLLETRRFTREDICAWFRVPPWMVGFGEKSSAWGTGMEQQMLAFLTFVLAPWLRRIEQGIKKDLLSAGDRLKFYPKFDTNGLLRADSAARADFYDKMIKAAVMTPDECRDLEDLSPMGGNAAKLLINSATLPLDKLGNGGSQNGTQQNPAA